MIINGKELADKIITQSKSEAIKLKKYGIYPKFAVIIVGDEDPASKTYVSNKRKACEKAEINSEEYPLPSTVSQEKIIEIIERLNADKTVSGILVQLPLPPHLNSKIICERISPLKDVDAFTSVNVGKLIQGTATLLPCTPAGIIEIFKHENINLEGKHCVVLGRSDIVGKPTAALLLQQNATVTVCHSKTKNITQHCKKADVLISAVGKRNFVNSEMVKKGAVIIDVGINKDEKGKLCGDVDFKSVEPLCSYITPVPGGVGPLTVAMLIKNTVTASRIQNERIIKE